MTRKPDGETGRSGSCMWWSQYTRHPSITISIRAIKTRPKISPSWSTRSIDLFHVWFMRIPLWPRSSEIEREDRNNNQSQQGSEDHRFHLRFTHPLRLEWVPGLEKQV